MASVQLRIRRGYGPTTAILWRISAGPPASLLVCDGAVRGLDGWTVPAPSVSPTHGRGTWQT